MKILRLIPEMDDNRLRTLFLNAQKKLLNDASSDDALLVIGEIEKEWQRRLKAFQEGIYKAQSPEEGVLKAIGYKVGNDGLPAHQRRALLEHILTRQLPPVGSPAYMAEWGAPGTKERYRKLHRVIRILASSALTLGNMEKAACEWEEDLEFLDKTWKRRCYESAE
jgi:hypothetical protein